MATFNGLFNKAGTEPDPAWISAGDKAVVAYDQSKVSYDFTTLPFEPSAQVGIEDYIGPVEVRPAGSKGWGLFTTRPVKVGEMVLCERALGVSTTSSHTAMIAANHKENRFNTQSQHDLGSLLIYRASRDPTLNAKLALLSSHRGHRVSKTIPPTSSLRHGGIDLPHHPPLSAHHIYGIIKVNAFAIRRSKAEPSTAARLALQRSLYDPKYKAMHGLRQKPRQLVFNPRNAIMEAARSPPDAAHAMKPGLSPRAAMALGPIAVQRAITDTPPEQRMVDLNMADSNGLTALHYAVIIKDVATCRVLIQAGADVNAQVREHRQAFPSFD